MTDSSPPADTTEQATLDFPCHECGRLLRVPATAVGRSARCPQCGNVQAITGRAPPSPAAASPRTPSATLPPIASPPPLPTAPPPSVSHPAGPQSATTPSAGSPPSVLAPGAGSAAAEPAAEPVREPSFAPAHPPRDTPTRQLFHRIQEEVAKVYVGQTELVLGTLVALFSGGHVLIESVPGLGKTLLIRTLGRVLGCRFGRIQFTADLMPSDITGAPILDAKTQEFRFRPGPVFTQLLLADEINRSPAKTHAALLEIMQEYHVTVDGVSHELQRPFLVMATQNPIESEGTYNLPEAQLDRFMFKLVANYPEDPEEEEILRLHSEQASLYDRLETDVQTVTGPAEILEITRANVNVHIENKLLKYINQIVRLTRRWPQFHMGASPRAGIALVQGARTLAAFSGRDYAVPDDVVQIALPTLRHRVMLTAEAEVEGRNVDALLTELVRSVEVPRL